MVQIDIDNINLKGHINGAKTIIKSKLNNEFKMEDDGYKIDASERGQSYATFLMCNIVNELTNSQLDYRQYVLHHKTLLSTQNGIRNLKLVKKEEHLKLHTQIVREAMGEFLNDNPAYLDNSPNKSGQFKINNTKYIFSQDKMPPTDKRKLAKIYMEKSNNANVILNINDCDCIDLYDIIIKGRRKRTL